MKHKSYKGWKQEKYEGGTWNDIVYTFTNPKHPDKVVQVYRAAPNNWWATVNNSWLTKENTKAEAMKYAKDYMERFS